MDEAALPWAKNEHQAFCIAKCVKSLMFQRKKMTLKAKNPPQP
jgi:hypothetical protein